ncbi:MAG: hypothetical protein EZS28_037359 [Streblomastix strix]|uniref:Uncharacterized protein n=1 Tax=Streblomastix strix TaxID=222440 RepID=A0A5J4UBX8_9EUKA|nr:MAG: hypothetical protein EZS28_037359 [Streblomastix strix]
MSISIQSLSNSSVTGDKESLYQFRVRRNVLRLPEYKIREILASLKFQDTGLEPEDPDYEVKVQLISTVLINEDKEKQAKGAKRQASKDFIPLRQIDHDIRMTSAEDSIQSKENDDTVDQKESRQQELLSELKEIDKSIKCKRSPESEQSSRSSRERNGLECLGRTQGADQIPGICQGPSLGLDPGPSVERRSFKPESVRARSRWLQDALDRRWRDEHVLPPTEPIEQSSIEQTSAYADISKSLSAADGAALGALKSIDRRESPTKHITDTYLMILSAGHRFRVIRVSANLYGWKRSHVLSGGNEAISLQTHETLEREAKLYSQNRNNRSYDYRSNDKRGSRHDYRSRNK